MLNAYNPNNMKNLSFLLITCLALTSLLSCGNKNKKTEAAQEHEEWLASLPDSIDYYTAEKQKAEEKIKLLHDSVTKMLPKFVFVNNQLHASGYTILRSWEMSYPLTATGIIARITAEEEFEIVAALDGSTFTSLEAVTNDGKKAYSDTIKWDQALNYRVGTLNIVSFQGKANDDIAELIANSHDQVTIVYKNPASAGSIRLTPETQHKFRETWLLYRTQKDVEHLEHTVPLLSRKIDILRSKIDSTENSADTDNVDTNE